MDTIQKNPETAVPGSARQRSGAAGIPEERRGTAGKTGKTPRPERKPEAPRQEKRNAPAAQRAAQPRKKTAGATGTAEKERSASAARKSSPPAGKTAQTAGKTAQTAGKKTRRPEPDKAAAGRKKKQQEPAYTHGLPDSVSTKKRAYGKTKPKKKNVLDHVNDAVKRSGEKKAEKILKRHSEMEKGTRKKPARRQDAPAVIYTEPQAFNRSRFLMQMVTVLAVVLALVLGLSVFFKVEDIRVDGATVYSNWAVQEASGIEKGDNLLTFSHARAAAQIKANLPYVKSVRFGIKLPDTVNIMIEEEDVVYAIKDQAGGWWLMNSKGKITEQSNNAVAARYTQVLGITVSDPVLNEYGVATESAVVYETDEAGATVPVPVSVTGAQRLNTALQILQALEANDIVGEAASVDVTRLEDIILWYGTRFQVNLGDSTNIAYKIDCMNDCILQMGEYQTGIMDISFTIWPSQVGFTPFS